jgi:hypothetical protein
VNDYADSSVFPIVFPRLDITTEEKNELIMAFNTGRINLGFG